MADKITYDVVSEFAGHTHNQDVEIVHAAMDIFTRVKEKAMQCAVKGEFIEFTTIAELQHKLSIAADSGFSIRCFDEVIGG
jgi:hypothetical protein